MSQNWAAKKEGWTEHEGVFPAFFGYGQIMLRMKANE
jgi:hypothetical protein